MFCYSINMSINSLRQSPSPEIQMHRKSAALLMGAIALLGVSEHKLITNGASSLINTANRVLNHSVTGSNGDLPALDTNFKIRGPIDTPDNIADHSGVQGSQDRKKFTDEILAEAHQQGEPGLTQGMDIEVPEQYVQYANNQSNQQ